MSEKRLFSGATGDPMTITMAGEDLQGRRARLNWARGGIACAVAIATLAGFICGADAQSAPSEAKILELLKQKRLMRCPTSPSEAGCGDARLSPLKSDAFTQEVEVFFGYASAAIDRTSRARLVALASELNAPDHAGLAVLIAGHADATGGDAHNQRLSERRAAMVKRFLIEHGGVSSERLAAAGFGERRPRNSADPYAGENRRVNITAHSSQ